MGLYLLVFTLATKFRVNTRVSCIHVQCLIESFITLNVGKCRHKKLSKHYAKKLAK